MHDDGQIFVLAIIGLSMTGGIVSTWIRAKHGYPLESRRGRRRARMNPWNPVGNIMTGMTGGHGAGDDIDAERKIGLLSDENEKLVGKIGRLEERLAVLERIATDPAERTAREIEALRGH